MATDPEPFARRLRRALGLALYYVLASHLPDLAFPGGRLYNAVRCATLRLALPRFGHDNEIDAQIYIGDGSDVYVGSGCQINRGCRLNRVFISDKVMIGPQVIVLGGMHRSDDLDIPMIEQGDLDVEPTVIEPDVWLGARAIVMPGLRIATGSIVAAGAVVTHDVPPRTVVAGVPARVIRHRDRSRAIEPGAG
jgi:maltose O-acetyltransferase